MQTAAVFFDGEIAAERPVKVTITSDGLDLDGPDVPAQSWTHASLIAVEPPLAGRPLRIKPLARPGIRLVIRDQAFAAKLSELAPQLAGGFNPRRAMGMAGIIAGGFAALAVISYLMLQFLPHRLAALVPESWSERMGTKIEAELVRGATLCINGEAQTAMSALVDRLASGSPSMPKVSVNMYYIPVMNAFAMPGGRIVVTSDLIANADTPEELVGVVAHEIGHVFHRHSEAGMIRDAGIQILISIATGSSDSDALSSLAGMATIMRYSREAEREADDYGHGLLVAAKIDPMGSRRFFEKLLMMQGEAAGSTADKIVSVFASHPPTRERMERVAPLPAGIKAEPALEPKAWRALKMYCG